MTADEALASGFATEVTENVTAKASFDMASCGLPTVSCVPFLRQPRARPSQKTIPPPEPTPAPVVENTPLTEQIVAAARLAGLDAHASTCTELHHSAEAQARMSAAREIVAPRCTKAPRGAPGHSRQHPR